MGHPGGPGRPPGSRNRAYAKYDALARDSMEEAVRAIGEKAAKGDPDCARLLFARVWPKAHDQVIELDLPPLDKPADLITAYSTLVDAIGRGEVSPEQAARISDVLERKRLAIETASHEPRLMAIEEKLGAKPRG